MNIDLNNRDVNNNQRNNDEQNNDVQSFVCSNNDNVMYTEESNIFLDSGNVSLNDIINQNKIGDEKNNFNQSVGDDVSTNVIEIDFSRNNSDDKVDKNRKILDIIFNRKTIMVLSILTFIFIGITVFKTFSLRNKVDKYEKNYHIIEEKLSMETIVYNDSKDNNNDNKTGAAMEMVNCIKNPLGKDEIPDSIKSIINEINNYYNQSNNYFAFKYKDIYTGFSVSYNENQNIFTASTIKAPKDIYIYEMASLGKINLNDKLTYTSKYANTGAWRLSKKKFNTQYDVRTLVEYSTVASDNAAHNMLMDHFGRSNMLSFWEKLGTTAIFTANNNWGITNSHDASIYMEELYRFYIEDEKYGQELMSNFLNASPKFITGKNNYKVANKSGWAGSAIHDVSIVFADNPYIIVALSNLGDKDYYMSYFNQVNDLAYRLHTEYWKYKMELCGNINQY